MAPARDSSYTPRTVSALGAIMGISKPDLDRAKIKSVKVFPAGTHQRVDYIPHLIGLNTKSISCTTIRVATKALIHLGPRLPQHGTRVNVLSALLGD